MRKSFLTEIKKEAKEIESPIKSSSIPISSKMKETSNEQTFACKLCDKKLANEILTKNWHKICDKKMWLNK